MDEDFIPNLDSILDTTIDLDSAYDFVQQNFPEALVEADDSPSKKRSNSSVGNSRKSRAVPPPENGVGDEESGVVKPACPDGFEFPEEETADQTQNIRTGRGRGGGKNLEKMREMFKEVKNREIQVIQETPYLDPETAGSFIFNEFAPGPRPSGMAKESAWAQESGRQVLLQPRNYAPPSYDGASGVQGIKKLSFGGASGKRISLIGSQEGKYINTSQHQEGKNINTSQHQVDNNNTSQHQEDKLISTTPRKEGKNITTPRKEGQNISITAPPCSSSRISTTQGQNISTTAPPCLSSRISTTQSQGNLNNNLKMSTKYQDSQKPTSTSKASKETSKKNHSTKQPPADKIVPLSGREGQTTGAPLGRGGGGRGGAAGKGAGGGRAEPAAGRGQTIGAAPGGGGGGRGGASVAAGWGANGGRAELDAGGSSVLRSRSVPISRSTFYKESPETFVTVTCPAVTHENREFFLGFIGLNYKADTYGEEYDLGQSIRFWFQLSFPNPQLAGQFIRNRPPPQVWGGGLVDYTLSSTKRKAVQMGAGMKV